MKNSWAFALALLVGTAPLNLPAETAQATLFCFSIQVHGATGSGGATLDLTTSASVINEELALVGAAYTHASYFVLDAGFEVIEGSMNLDVPLGLDGNGNGFDDFFETSRGVAVTNTTGNFNTGISTGTIQAQWNRSAGSKNGTCVLTLTDNIFGNLGTFSHAFELLEYTGPLAYTPGATNVSGTVNLTRTGNPAETLKGPVNFIKSSVDPYNQLELQPGVWTNATAQSLAFLDDIFNRDPAWPTNYFGYVFFNDGLPATADPDYAVWQFSIDDANDTDHDGIPNFSDTIGGGGGPRRPRLTLRPGTTNLWLDISGEVGRLHHILSGTNFLTGTWQTNLSVTLTNDPQTVALPKPATNLRYWRAWVP